MKKFTEMTSMELAEDTMAKCNLWSSKDWEVWKGLTLYRIFTILRDYNDYAENKMEADSIRERTCAVYKYVNSEE